MSVKKLTQRLESTKITKPPHNNQNGEGKPSENLKCSLVGATSPNPGSSASLISQSSRVDTIHTDFYGAEQWESDDGRGGAAWEGTRELREATTADCDVRNRLCGLEKAP